ncbi:DDE-type integrase/transposase/recombinase [Micromonospora echinofusca]|uniref:DDE-type integrase/transposase/recombinase n=1 Tax=Micromonospora echinofusca TaxID=47858 RepID=A0ABS3VNU3_MICEH|nr:DDE-type integrase/transposase/recombinase [Micromonospora echinofusca]
MIVLAVRWYLRFNLSYRDVEDLLVERGVEADRVTVYRWVQQFTPLLVDAARFARHSPGTPGTSTGPTPRSTASGDTSTAVDQHGQVIDMLVSARRDAAVARRFLHRALTTLKVTPTEVVTDAAPAYVRVLDDLLPSAWHHIERHANNPTEADHSQPSTGSHRCAGSAPTAPPGGRHRARLRAEPHRDTTNSPSTSARVAGGRLHRTRTNDLTI